MGRKKQYATFKVCDNRINLTLKINTEKKQHEKHPFKSIIRYFKKEQIFTYNKMNHTWCAPLTEDNKKIAKFICTYDYWGPTNNFEKDILSIFDEDYGVRPTWEVHNSDDEDIDMTPYLVEDTNTYEFCHPKDLSECEELHIDYERKFKRQTQRNMRIKGPF